ncbi:MAG: hypothetical protein Kow0099_09880 [Candidatus Abyssubacteria bacterium]
MAYGYYFQYDDWDAGGPEWPRPGRGEGTLFNDWFFADNELVRALPWVGAIAIALGLLVLVFPMLLVVAVAALFFAAGTLCLALWWQLRGRASARWHRARRWFQTRLG